ncbi:MAG: hypothetical protein IKL90_06725 [Alphaproteobacteria bacterium]|nr:hypothetical protein [Alphaproteobacteria bacterium]
MEKSSKSKKDIAFVLDTRTVNKQKKHYELEANESQKQALKKFFELPDVMNLTFEFDVFLNKEYIEINGILRAKIKQKCVVSSDEFETKISEPVRLLFTEDESFYNSLLNKADFSMDEDDVDFVENGRIYFYDIIQEQFGLALNPFPKKTKEAFSYYELKAEDVVENPFAVLKHLTK